MATPPARVLSPTNPIAPRALLPGDPGRALALASALLERPLMCNHARGLWGYTGTAADGLPLTVQSTGIGGPSAAAVLADLAALGLREAVRVGTARALHPGLAPGDLVAARSVLALDGTSRAIRGGADAPLRPDPELLAALEPAATASGDVASSDLWEAPAPPDAVASDLQSAAVLAAAGVHGVRVAVLLVVAEGLDEAAGEAAVLRSGAAAAAALGVPAAELA